MALTPDQLYRARLRLGDTAQPYLLPDEAYNAVLTDPDVTYNEGLAELAEAIAMMFADSDGVSLALGDQTYKESSGGRAKYYLDLAASLRATSPYVYSAPRVGTLVPQESVEPILPPRRAAILFNLYGPSFPYRPC